MSGRQLPEPLTRSALARPLPAAAVIPSAALSSSLLALLPPLSARPLGPH